MGGRGMSAAMDAARAALHLDVACPACGARFSEPCRTAAGKHARVHAQRAAWSSAQAVMTPLFGLDDGVVA